MAGVAVTTAFLRGGGGPNDAGKDGERRVGLTGPKERIPSLTGTAGELPRYDGWYVAIEDKAQGPLTADDLKAQWSRGEIGADTLGWREGMGEWRPLSRLHNLAVTIAPVRGRQLPGPRRPRSRPSTSAPLADGPGGFVGCLVARPVPSCPLGIRQLAGTTIPVWTLPRRSSALGLALAWSASKRVSGAVVRRSWPG